ncbi:MAG: OB-fold domain-containing protein [Chloroflexota bacterium]
MADIPWKEGLFHAVEGKEEHPYLCGSRCRVCGYTSFPEKEVCLVCRRDDTMENIKLGSFGNLVTFTVMRVGPPDFPPPYVIGYVKLKEGPVIFTQLSGVKPEDDALKIGEEMELVIEKLKQNERGDNLLAWKYRPVRK